MRGQSSGVTYVGHADVSVPEISLAKNPHVEGDVVVKSICQSRFPILT